MMYRCDMYYADLSPVVGCEQGGVRPVLIIQNNVGNRYSPTVIVAAYTNRCGNQPEIWLAEKFDDSAGAGPYH